MLLSKHERKKEVIKLSIDTWFPDQESLYKGVVDFLAKEGTDCSAVDKKMILLNGKKYTVSKRTVLASHAPYQEQRLTEV